MYSKTTKKINITVKPYYLEDQSEPEDQHYVWAYRIRIDNQGNDVSEWKLMSGVSDLTRIDRQQYVVTQLIKELKNFDVERI